MSETDSVEVPTEGAPAQKWRTPDENEPAIVMYTYYTDENGVRHRKEHGPMPVPDYAEYERKMEAGEL